MSDPIVYGAKLPNKDLPWPMAWEGVVLLAQKEQCSLVSYRDFAKKKWTIGWGETEGVGPSMRWTQEKCDQTLCDDLVTRCDAVRAMCTIPPTDNELAALVVFSYNCGLDALRKSSILRAHNRGDTAAAANAFKLYNEAEVDGKTVVVHGLVVRRAQESALYLTPDPEALPPPMPQAVSPESNLTASPITVTGLLTTTGGALTAASGASDQIKGIMDTIHSFGINPQFVLAGLLIAGGVYIVLKRLEQRRGGWA
jgi:GH24 family phage-related lysozyme (muramidase)